MRTLVIDTATQALSVALLDDGKTIGHFHEVVGRGHAEALVPAIAALPDGGRAEGIAVDLGPGSFTGVRIGIAAARALALAWSLPLHGYCALSLIAAKAAQSRDQDGGPIAVTITGGHGELFWQCFDADGLTAVTQPASTPIATLAKMLDQPMIYGTGAEALVTARGHGTAVNLYPNSADFPLIAGLAPLPPSPIYCREADAQPMPQQARS